MKSKVIFVVGPTATNKTKTAIELAKEINGEVISCDSMQIYKDMTILSQAPSKRELLQIPHYLIAEIRPQEEYNAAEFSRKAKKIIKDIIKRKKTPIITGGTGLYVKSLIDGLFPSPKKNPALRKKLEKKSEKNSSRSLYDELKKIDPASASKIHQNDTRRLIRALEIYYLTGTPISFHKEKTKGIKDRYNIIEAGINLPRALLYDNINKRVDRMFKEGVIEEVKELLNNKLSITAKSAIGIKEIRDYLEGKINLDAAKEIIKKKTRNYAKRQLTWFGHDKRIKWFTDGKGIINYCRSGQ